MALYSSKQYHGAQCTCTVAYLVYITINHVHDFGRTYKTVERTCMHVFTEWEWFSVRGNEFCVRGNE